MNVLMPFQTGDCSMTPSSRRGLFSPCRVLALCGLSLAALALPGCSLIQGPPVAAAPPIVQKPLFPVFDATDYLTPWTATKMPGFYRVTGVTSGEILTIQGVNMVPKGRTMIKQYGVPAAVRLSGIVAPAPGQPGWQNTTNKVSSWLAGKEDLEVEVDPKYPVDLQNHRMVQVYFHPSAKGAGTGGSSSAGARSTGSSSSRSSSTALSSAGASSTGSSSTGASASGERWNLNRMLVHTGYAVVDLFGATSIDVQKWLNDEEFAKNYVDRKTGTIKPLGLWGLGITIPQRGIPTRGKGAIAVMPGSTSAIGSTVQGTLQSSQTTQTQQSRTTTQTGPSSTGATSGLPSSASTMPSNASPSATTPSTSTPSAMSSTTASASRSTRSVTTPSSAATSTTSSATNSVSTSR
jgi:hypothetical protein